jgi:cytochrome c oxidase cbb3-type subunit IV
MDIGLFRSIMTVVLFAAFIGIVLWAWSSRRSADFEAASRLAVNDGEDELNAIAGARR